MTDSRVAVEPKLAELKKWFRDVGSVLVCYSGGIDSAFVLAVAHGELGDRAVGMTAVSPSLAASERQDAERIAHDIGATHRFVESHEIERPGYVANGPDRCYHCKTELYEIARAKRAEWGLRTIVNGTNADDLGDYRPGLGAAREAGVESPLVELGFTKADVRAAAKSIGLAVWGKPASACLSSRIPYGTQVTPERLDQIGGFEADLKKLGFRNVRVRWHDTVARIEVDVGELPRFFDEAIRPLIVAAGRKHGFSYVTADLAGYRQGSHNEVLSGRSLRVV